jgi:hypothetical protein
MMAFLHRQRRTGVVANYRTAVAPEMAGPPRASRTSGDAATRIEAGGFGLPLRSEAVTRL